MRPALGTRQPCVLILAIVALSAPAFAGRVDITNGSALQSVFGTIVAATGPNSATATFTLTVDANVYQNGDTYTYVYEPSHDSATPLNTLTVASNDFDPNLDWGVVDAASKSALLHGADFTGNLTYFLTVPLTDTVRIYAQSSNPPTDVQFFGIDGGFSGFGGTVGPDAPRTPTSAPLPAAAWLGLGLLGAMGGRKLIVKR